MRRSSLLSKSPSGFFHGERFGEENYVVCLVGLPARGKSYTATKVARYLCWLGMRARVFNAGNKRREMIGAGQPASFFDPDNETAAKQREQVARETLEDMFTFLEEEDGVVGIFDATNSTFERRAWVREECKARGIKLLFLESICNTPEVIAKNVVAAKTHGNPDYKSVKDEEAIIRDFQQRVSMYEKRYQTVSVEEQVPHIKTINQGEELRLFRIEGWVPSRITFFLMNMKVRSKRRVWLCRHGESEYNVRGILGGDSCLSERGKQFSHRLNDYILTKVGADCPDNEVPYIWTSTLQRTKLTALHLAKRYPLLQWKCLEEIDAGICDSMTQEEIDAKYPEIAAARKKEKFTFRYPQGESYQDLILRSQPALLQMENSERDLVIIVHNAVVRMFYAYFNDIDPELVTTLDIPLHRVYEFVALPHGQYQMTYEDLDIDGPGSVQD